MLLNQFFSVRNLDGSIKVFYDKRHITFLTCIGIQMHLAHNASVHTNRNQITLINTGIWFYTPYCSFVYIICNHSKCTENISSLFKWSLCSMTFWNTFPGHLERIWPKIRDRKSNRIPNATWQHMNIWSQKKRRQIGKTEIVSDDDGTFRKKKSATFIKKIPICTRLIDENISICCKFIHNTIKHRLS